MHNLNRQIPTTFLPQAIAPAGKRAYELNAYDLAIIDCDTNLTVDAANYSTDKRYQLVYLTGNKGMGSEMFPDAFGAKLPIRIDLGKVTNAHVFDDASEAKPFVAYWGWDGISDCKTISLECGQDYGLQITVRGQSIRNTFNRNLTEIVPFHTGCCDDCNLDEKCELTTDNILKAIEKSSFYIDHYFDAEKVKSCCPAELPFEKKPYKEYTLTVCDNGTTSDLAKVQRQYPDFKVECIERNAPYSVYAVCIPCVIETPDDPNTPDVNEEVVTCTAPEAYVEKNVKQLVCDECPECPDTFEKVEAGDKFTACIFSPLLTDTTEAFDLEYYVDQDTAQDTIDSLVETYVANIPGYIPGSAELLGTTCDDITIQACIVEGTEVTEHGVAGLKLNKIGECKGFCKGEKSTDWCPGKDLYKIDRTLCLTVKKDDCTEGVDIDETHPLFLEVKESLQYDKSILIDTLTVKKDNDCLVTFTVDQCNNECLEDGCDTYGKDGAKFDRIAAYKGILWETCDCEGWTVDEDTGCLVCPTIVEPDNCLCGIKFTAALVNPETGTPCTYDIHDYMELEPIEIELTLIRQYEDESTLCDPTFIDWTVVQYGQKPTGLGQNVGRDEVLSRQYDLGMYFNPKGAYGNLFQDRTGYEYAFDPSKKYNYIGLYINRDLERTYHKHDARERHLVKLYVDNSNVQFFEELKTFLNKTLLNHGLCKLL